MSEIVCEVSDSYAKWSFIDLVAWKLVPERVGGGKTYIQNFKDAWVAHNSLHIKNAAAQQKFPAALLAGIAWVETGGDPNAIDKIAFGVRSFDWSGPQTIDKYLTVTKHPSLTSFGSISVQLRTAAKTMGLDASTMSASDLKKLATCLEKDVFNIQLAAKHVREIIDHDELQKLPPFLSMDDVRIVGARYNRGLGLTLEQIQKNTSYGDFLVKHWARFTRLVG